MKAMTKNTIIVVAGCLAFFCVWFFFSGSSEPSDPLMETAQYYQPAPTPGSALETIEADAEIKIPPSAREIHAVISGFRELDTWVRFNLPKEDISIFLNSTLCELPLTDAMPKNYAPNDLDPDWWQPNTSTNLAECHGGNSSTQQNILIDRTNPEIFIIYVFSWTG